MQKSLQIRLDVELDECVTAEEWNEYRGLLIAKLRAAHEWHKGSQFNWRVFEVFEGGEEVISEIEEPEPPDEPTGDGEF